MIPIHLLRMAGAKDDIGPTFSSSLNNQQWPRGAIVARSTPDRKVFVEKDEQPAPYQVIVQVSRGQTFFASFLIPVVCC